MTKGKRLKVQRIPLYIDPTSDFGFHRLFGEEANKDLLIDFLNSMLPEYHQIADLTFKQREQTPEQASERIIIYDIHCVAKSGEYFIVEMQKASQKNFAERTLFYGSTAVSKQGRKGKKWQYALKTVYFFGILDFDYDTDTNRWGKRKLLRKFTLKDEDGIELTDKMQIRYLQLPFFKKRRHQLTTQFDKWCYFLKNLEDFDKIPNILNEAIFMKALTVTKLNKMSTIDYLAYLKKSNDKMDTELALEDAEEKGMAKGIEKGIEKGIIKTIESILKQGILSVENIAVACNITVEDVLEIKENLNKKKISFAETVVKRKRRVAKPKPQTPNLPQAN
jgi:predicted transposase/invertase (TIGR01784 family)